MGVSGMNDSKAFASLSPTLLARKGGAKPAMRQFQESAVRLMQDELGWNDMGDAEDEAGQQAEIISISGGHAGLQPMPEVVRQQAGLENRVSQVPPARRSALSEGRRAAFTLRLDAQRHLKLRLASTVLNRSAQQLVTEALDKFLEDYPDLEKFADKVRDSR